MYYDLHIHSALSPCSDDDMSVNNIVSMACLIGLDLIAITDHNSLKQLKILKKICQDRIQFLYGVELHSQENVHLLAYFDQDQYLDDFQRYIDMHLPNRANQPEFYGHQWIFDDQDQVIDREDRLLVQPLDVPLRLLVDKIHQYDGAAVLAHALNKKYSVTSVFGHVPLDLDIDAIEVRNRDQINTLRLLNPSLNNDMCFLVSSDAHMLGMIADRDEEITSEILMKMFRRSSCKT